MKWAPLGREIPTSALVTYHCWNRPSSCSGIGCSDPVMPGNNRKVMSTQSISLRSGAVWQPNTNGPPTVNAIRCHISAIFGHGRLLVSPSSEGRRFWNRTKYKLALHLIEGTWRSLEDVFLDCLGNVRIVENVRQDNGKCITWPSTCHYKSAAPEHFRVKHFDADKTAACQLKVSVFDSF